MSINSEQKFEEYAKQLTNVYRETYDKCYIYVASHCNLREEFELTMNDVVDLLLSAQENSSPIEKIIGDDIEEFCKNIIKGNRLSFARRSKIFIRGFLSVVIVCLIFEIVDLVMFYIEPTGANPWTQSTSISGVICGLIPCLLLTTVYDFVVRILIKKTKWFRRKQYIACGLILIGICLVSAILIAIYFDINIVIPRFVAISIEVLYIIVYFIMKKFSDKDLQKQGETSKRKSRKIYCDPKVKNEIIDVYCKNYEKDCKKREKKGQPILSVNEWCREYIRREKKGFVIYSIVAICISVASITYTAIGNAFLDTIIFGLVILALVGGISAFVIRSDFISKNILTEIMEGKIDFLDDEVDSLNNNDEEVE